jgi:hypothetical protein
MPRAQPESAGAEAPWPADQVERWQVERLRPYANNARLHSAADIDRIAASIRNWGWTMPVLADEDGARIAGHARLRAAANLGLTSIPVIVVRGWSEDENRAYRERQSARRGGKVGTPAARRYGVETQPDGRLRE